MSVDCGGHSDLLQVGRHDDEPVEARVHHPLGNLVVELIETLADAGWPLCRKPIADIRDTGNAPLPCDPQQSQRRGPVYAIEDQDGRTRRLGEEIQPPLDIPTAGETPAQSAPDCAASEELTANEVHIQIARPKRAFFGPNWRGIRHQANMGTTSPEALADHDGPGEHSTGPGTTEAARHHH